jgi:hypothetical protein
VKRNLLALLLLLVSCALASRFLFKPAERPEWDRMRKHMESCLNVFWGTPNNAVQLVAGSDGNPQAWVTAFSPPGITPQRERWNFALLGFIASHHPGLQLSQLNVTNGTTGIRLQPGGTTATQESLRPGAASRPYESGMAELIRRQQQSDYDQRYGPNQVLALVEVTSPPADHVSIWLVHFAGIHPQELGKTERIVELPAP